MHLTPQICCATKLLNDTVRKKFTKAEFMKRIMKEHKASFGALLETKREKIRRLKLEKKGAIAPAKVESSGNSELAWMLKSSASLMRFIRIDTRSKMSVAAATPEKTASFRAKNIDKLSRVQTRIIRKTCGSKAVESKTRLLESAVTINHDQEKIRINEKCTKLMKLKSKMVNPPVALAVVNDNSKETETAYKTLLKNMSKASLFHKEQKKSSLEHSSEILSISPMDNKDYFHFPSVTRILNATMSDNDKKMLELWMAKMINELGQEGFDEYKRGLIQNGRLLHSAIDCTLRKLPVKVPDNIKPCLDSVKIVLDEVRDVRAIESHVVHHNLGYRGVVDCVASYRGNLCLIDWKKSDKTKHLLSSTYDAPLQIASYIGALNVDKNYPFQIRSGLLVIAYTIGNPSTVFTLDQRKLQYFWKQWIVRLKKYYTMQNTS